MILATILSAAVLGMQSTSPVVALRPQDRRAECPAWIVEAIAENDNALAARDRCIWTDTSDQAQTHYVGELARFDWRAAGGLANVLFFRKTEHCLAMAGFPVEQPEDEAIGSDRNLLEPRPADQAAVLLMFVETSNACASMGAR